MIHVDPIVNSIVFDEIPRLLIEIYLFTSTIFFILTCDFDQLILNGLTAGCIVANELRFCHKYWIIVSYFIMVLFPQKNN